MQNIVITFTDDDVRAIAQSINAPEDWAVTKAEEIRARLIERMSYEAAYTLGYELQDVVMGEDTSV